MGGGTPIGTKAWQQWNVNELTDINNYDAISGFPVYKSLLCEVVKIESDNAETREADTRHVETETPVSITKPSDINKSRIWLDNNATTRIADEVRQAMLPYLDAAYGNPSSIHTAGRDAHDAMEIARRLIARLINAQPRRIIFTGGGSEADNLAIKGVAFAIRDKGNHIITSSIEHPAVLNTCRFLERLGFDITYLEADEFGFPSPEKLKNAITDKTILVSIMMANNEIGTILPVKQLCAAAHEKGVLFHTDAVQAIGKISVDVEELGVDLLSLSGHKFHAPKGIGALYVRKGVDLESLVHGGKQEAGLRAGTENVPAIAGLGKAAELALYHLTEYERIKVLRDKLETKIRNLIPGTRLNGHPENRLPNTLNLTLPGLRGESIVIALDHHGIAVSSGSACKSGSPEPTHVLLAIGRTEQEAHCSVRFSLSRYTISQEIDRTVAALAAVLEEKNTVRLMPCK